jgi:hypothetical protein
LLFSVFRKPSATDVIINCHSCHPPEHKNLAIKFLVNRVQNYPVSDGGRRKELTTIKHILNNNVYPHDYRKTTNWDHEKQNQHRRKKRKTKSVLHYLIQVKKQGESTNYLKIRV